MRVSEVIKYKCVENLSYILSKRVLRKTKFCGEKRQKLGIKEDSIVRAWSCILLENSRQWGKKDYKLGVLHDSVVMRSP